MVIRSGSGWQLSVMIGAFRLLAVALALATWSLPVRAAHWDDIMESAQDAYLAKDPIRYESLLRKALGVAETYGPDNIRVLITLNKLGESYMAGGRFLDALPILERELYVLDRRRLPDDIRIAFNQKFVGETYRQMRQYDKAEQPTRRAAEIFEKVQGISDPETIHARRMLAYGLRHQGKLQDSEREYLKALAGARAKQDLAWQCLVAYELAEVYAQQGKTREAEDLYQSLLKDARQAKPVDSTVIKGILNRYAEFKRSKRAE